MKQCFNLVLLESNINLTSSWVLASKTNITVQKGGYVNTFLFLCRIEFDRYFLKVEWNINEQSHEDTSGFVKSNVSVQDYRNMLNTKIYLTWARGIIQAFCIIINILQILDIVKQNISFNGLILRNAMSHFSLSHLAN